MPGFHNFGRKIAKTENIHEERRQRHMHHQPPSSCTSPKVMCMKLVYVYETSIYFPDDFFADVKKDFYVVNMQRDEIAVKHTLSSTTMVTFFPSSH